MKAQSRVSLRKNREMVGQIEPVLVAEQGEFAGLPCGFSFLLRSMMTDDRLMHRLQESDDGNTVAGSRDLIIGQIIHTRFQL